MKIVAAITKRELKKYFYSPIAYTVVFFFLAFASFLTFKSNFFEYEQSDLRIFFNQLPLLFIVLCPSVGMSLWAEERKTGTIELLFSLPVTVVQSILGKYIAAWIFLGFALFFSFPFVFTVNYLGHPDNVVILAGYFGSFLLAGSYLSMAILFSVMTKSQVISFVTSVISCAIFSYIDYPSIQRMLELILPDQLIEITSYFGFISHYESIMRGVISLTDIAFYCVIGVGMLSIAGLLLTARKVD